jgi:predicted kinase
MFGIEETQPLPPESYTPTHSDAVYARLMQKAAAVLAAGHSVVVDAVFGKADEKLRVAEIAARGGVPFRALWLTAPDALLKARVEARRGDASDATSEVVEQQLKWHTSNSGWAEIDASGPPADVLAAASRILE